MGIQRAAEGFNSIAVSIARQNALQSSCRRRQIGAVVFDGRGIWVCDGWNNDLDSELSCAAGQCPRGLVAYDKLPADAPYGNCISQHAEMMCLQKMELLMATFPDQVAANFTMVVTHSPCHECTPVLERVGMEVFYLEEL